MKPVQIKQKKHFGFSTFWIGCFLVIFLFLLQLSSVWAVSSPVSSSPHFSDVSPESWYAATVSNMTEAGWLTGYPDGTFRPEANISASEFVAVTARRAGLAPADTDSGHWAAGFLTAALQAGWYDWDELPPTGETWDQPISRQVAVKILMQALSPDARGDYATWSTKINDFSTLNGRYYETTFAAYALGVLKGDGQGNFRPLDPLSRAEACTLIERAGKTAVENPSPFPAPTSAPTQAPVLQSGGVSEHGWLHVSGTQLCGQNGEPVRLRGVSSHGIQWYEQFTSYNAIHSTALYGANVFRVAMYTAEGGFLTDASLADRAFQAVDAAVQNDMYVILDWHVLSDQNPRNHTTEAVSFFRRAAQRYANTPHVLYEICNEPNGSTTWAGDVKPYAQEVIAAIRAESPNAVVLVGSPTWSQDIHLAAADPLDEPNVMYTFHFYAGTHGKALQDRLAAALDAGLPLFVTEWGVSKADGSQGVYLTESAQWLAILDRYGISWCSWSLCDKDESSALLKPGVSPDGPWQDSDLSEAGRFVLHQIGLP